MPTYNEKANIEPLARRIVAALEPEQIGLEILFVDDNSPDGTAAAAEALKHELPLRVIKRLDKRGLGSAIVDGINAAASPVICVIDADLSHPPEAIPEMYRLIRSGQAQLVVGSRRVSGGGTSKWIWYRRFIHWVAKTIGSFLTPVRDLTSGFFMFEKRIIDGITLEPRSWKIGLEIMVKGKHDKVIEHPIVFVEREAGQSKMSGKEVVSYILHVMALTRYKLTHWRKR
ncbi:MAG: polyprenol monophosphomannose synthase [Candidatus Saganbacteria bacterium]|nr:polyprenol monophosphomannose synthase [Candidatus Saganbacteria bacterium]